MDKRKKLALTITAAGVGAGGILALAAVLLTRRQDSTPSGNTQWSSSSATAPVWQATRTAMRTVTSVLPQALQPDNGEALVLYPADYGGMASDARLAARRLGGRAVRYRSGQEILDILRPVGRIRRLVIIGHGGPMWIGRPREYGLALDNIGRSLPQWATVSDLASVIRGKLTDEATVALAACSTGATPRADRSWDEPLEYAWDGGQGSLAHRLSESISARVTGHSKRGSALGNPYAREFPSGRHLFHAMGERRPTTPEDLAPLLRRYRGDPAFRWLVDL